MFADFAKHYLHGDLRKIREVMLAKLDGLSAISSCSSGSRLRTAPVHSVTTQAKTVRSGAGRQMISVTVRLYVRLYGHVGTDDR
jgi:hypothetical protein